MHVTGSRSRAALWGALVAAGLSLAACAGSESAKTDTKAPATSNAPAGQSAPATGGASAADPGLVQADGSIKMLALDNKFDPKTLTFKAGQQVTLTLENKGAAVHDFQMIGVSDSNGKVIKTKLLPGGQSDTITFTVNKTGTFDFYCEVHPAEMRGKATVQAAS